MLVKAVYEINDIEGARPVYPFPSRAVYELERPRFRKNLGL